MKKIAILLCFCVASSPLSAMSVDSVESGGTGHRTTGSDPTNLNWSFTNTAGTKLVCGFVVTGLSSNPAVGMSTPTYNSVSMTNVSTQQSFGSARSVVGIYYLDSPATGSNAVSINGTGGASGDLRVLGGCMSFSATTAGIVTATNGTNTSGTTATAGSITATSGNFIFAAGGWGSGEGGTAGGSFTRTYLTNGSNGTAGDDILGEYIQADGSSISPTFTWTASDNWAIIAVELPGGASAPTVVTNSVFPIGIFTATGNGNVTSDGGDSITERGGCWSTSADPTTSDTCDTTAGTTGVYTYDITGLTHQTLYHTRAYATNATGTSYGVDKTFTSLYNAQGNGLIIRGGHKTVTGGHMVIN